MRLKMKQKNIPNAQRNNNNNNNKKNVRSISTQSQASKKWYIAKSQAVNQWNQWKTTQHLFAR